MSGAGPQHSSSLSYSFFSPPDRRRFFLLVWPLRMLLNMNSRETTGAEGRVELDISSLLFSPHH